MQHAGRTVDYIGWLAKRTGRRRVRQRCAGLNRTGLAGPPQDGPQDNIAAEFSVAADAESQLVLFRWHYRTAAAGPPYNVNNRQFVTSSTW